MNRYGSKKYYSVKLTYNNRNLESCAVGFVGKRTNEPIPVNG